MPIHVDAASGGFIAPFATPKHIWDFKIPRVVSINTSGHKFGLSYSHSLLFIMTVPDIIRDSFVGQIASSQRTATSRSAGSSARLL